MISKFDITARMNGLAVETKRNIMKKQWADKVKTYKQNEEKQRHF